MKETLINVVAVSTGVNTKDTYGMALIKGASLGFGVTWVIGFTWHLVETYNTKK